MSEAKAMQPRPKWKKPKWTLVDYEGHPYLKDLPEIKEKPLPELRDSIIGTSLLRKFTNSSRDTAVLPVEEWLVDKEREGKFPLSPDVFENFESYFKVMSHLA